MVYKYHTDYCSNTILDRDEGFIVRKNEMYYQKIHKKTTIFFGSEVLIVDDENKRVLVDRNTKKNELFSFSIFLSQYFDKKIIEHSDFWVCELSNPKNSFTQYSKVRFYFYKKDYSLYKQVYYTEGKQNFILNGKKIQLVNPRLELILYKMDFTPFHSNLFHKKNYYELVKEKIILNKKISNYKLVTN